MSPSIASIVTPFRSPAVLSMSALLPEISSTSRSSRCLPRCLASEPASLLHARGQALLLVLAQLFLRVELPPALLTLEQLHGCSPFRLQHPLSGVLGVHWLFSPVSSSTIP